MELIKQYIKVGGAITGVELCNDKLYYNVNTGMKADMLISPLGNNNYAVKTRYDDYDAIELTTPEDIVDFAFDHCMCGRDYCSYTMEDLAIKYKIRTGIKSIDDKGIDKRKRIKELKDELKKLEKRG